MLIFADPHIEEKNMSELEEVFKEIKSYIEPFEDVLCLGDYYHKKRPTAKELEFGTKWIKKLLPKVASKYYMLRGNHPVLNHKDNP